MKVKEIDRTAHVAWSPAHQFPILMATGTAAQQLDATFSTSSSLEIYGLNLLEPGLDMICKGSLAIDHRFHSLCWGGPETSAGGGVEDVCGVLVGGCDGGKLFVYNPKVIISGDPDASIFQSEKHTGPIRALDFNPFQSNLLASGASDSEIYIWDLNSLSSPMTPGAKSQPTDDVTSIAWNCQVQHILASTFATRCVVWDLRKNEPIIKVSSSTSRMRCKVVAWHPEIATQMCLASEDDSTPFIQLWDLRFAASPLKTMDNQQRGVLSLAWCPQDPDLLLSGGKDHRILCWNPNSSLPGGEIVCEIPTSNQWSFDVAWCPRNPGLISSCSYDGHVSIFSLMGEQQQARPSSKVAEAFLGVGANMNVLEVSQPAGDSKVVLKHPPKWLKRPISVSFGFGGKLVSYDMSSKQGAFSSQIYISQVVVDPDVSRQAKQLEEVLANRNFSEFCAAKVGLSSNPTEAEIWSFIQAKFDADAKSKFLSLLGHPRSLPAEGTEFNRNDSPEELFDHISQNSGVIDDAQFVIPKDDGLAGQVSRCMLADQLEQAMELCLENDLITEGLLLGIAGGGRLLSRAQEVYFKKNNSDPLTRLISAIVHRDWDRIVSTCKLESWREALAGCLVYNNPSEFDILCEKLGDRLSSEGGRDRMSDAAVCYIIAGRIGKFVDCWWNLTPDHSQPAALQLLAEQVIILKQIFGQTPTDKGSDVLGRCLSDYAHLIASQGNLSSALIYAQAAQNDEGDGPLLLHRIQKALGIAGLRISSWPAVGPTQPEQQQQQPSLSNQTQPVTAINSRPRPRFDSGSSAENVPRSNTRGLQRYSTAPSNTAFGSTAHQPVPFYPTAHQPIDQSSSVLGYSNTQPSVYAPPTATAVPQYDGNVTFYGSAQFSQPPLPVPVAFIPPPVATPQPLHYSPHSDVDKHSQPIADVPHYSTQDLKPGWNDPPLNVSSRTAARQDFGAPLAPITHPMYASDVQQVPDMTNQYQQQQQVPPTYDGYHMQQPIQPVVQQHQQQPPPQPQPNRQAAVPTPKAPEPVKELPPIPAEHVILRDVFEELKTSCILHTTNMQIKRKLEDVSKKLEVLYNKLRDNSLSASSIYSLHQIVQFVQQHDYPSALAVHSQVVATIAFSEISGFMPGIKVLIQTAQQANVYLR